MRFNQIISEIYIDIINKNASGFKGVVLDVGCGTKPYEKIISNYCDKYIGLDRAECPHGDSRIDIFSDATDLVMENESCDWVVAFQVMEHLPEPSIFLSEAYRVLKKGGKVFLMTPFMWHEHEEPYDFFRYTRYGLQYLAQKAGFEVQEVKPYSGFWVTLTMHINYYLSYHLADRLGKFRWLLSPIWLNQYFALFMDRLDKKYSRNTCGFYTILRKP